MTDQADTPDPCQHESCSGDEGPARDLPGGDPVRWCCDGCGAITYDDTSLARLREQLRSALAELAAARDREAAVRGLAERLRRKTPPSRSEDAHGLDRLIESHDEHVATAIDAALPQSRQPPTDAEVARKVLHAIGHPQCSNCGDPRGTDRDSEEDISGMCLPCLHGRPPWHDGQSARRRRC